MSVKKISIITVVLNGEKSIERCLNSVINQKYPSNKIEHIIIDGGSKDKTVNILKKYKNKISYWHSKKDKGLYDAMNKGISKCTGEIIGILNSDDYFYPNTFRIVSNYFLNFKIDYLFGSVIKKRVYHNFFPQRLWYTFNIYPSHSVSFFITSKAQKKIGKYNINFKYSADRDLIYKLIKSTKFRGIPTKKKEIFGKFNMQGISSKVNFLTKINEEIKIRIFNKQNILQILIVYFVFFIYHLKNFFRI